MKKSMVLFLTGWSTFLLSQEKVTKEIDKISVKDTVGLKKSDEIISIPPVVFWAKPVFKDLADQKRFLYLKRKVYKVWPYVQMAKKIYILSKIKKEQLNKRRDKRRYIRKVQDSLMKKYQVKLKNFSHTDGRIMMKLIHRQTGKTTYKIVQESKSGWSAFWWNLKAGIFTLNLKDTLDIKNNRDDYFVEYITNQGILNGSLKEDALLLYKKYNEP